MSKNTTLDGIAASEHLDSSGESLDISGMDISSLGGPDSILNWEHGSKDKPSQVVGKVTFARKILTKEDAQTRREKYFWNKSKKPFVYIKAELFDGLGHSGAQDVAAMLKYKNKDKGEDSRLVVGFSIEGGKMDKKGMVVSKSIARDVAITVKPCNKVCDAEILENTKDDKDFLYKNQTFDCEVLEKGDLYVNLNSYEQFSKTEGKFRSMILNDIKKTEKKPTIKVKPKEVKKAVYETKNNMRKTLIAGMMGGAPSGKTGMAALATEELVGKKKVKKIKKNQPSMGFKSLGIENRPDMQVKTVNPEQSFKTKSGQEVPAPELEGRKMGNKYVQGQKEVSGADSLSDWDEESQKNVMDIKSSYEGAVDAEEQNGVNVADPEFGINEAIDFSGPGQNREEMKRTKGRGNFPSTKHHEGLHRTFSEIAEKHSPNHSQNLISHIMDNFFHPDDVAGVSDFVSTRYDNDDPHLKEENLTHILDLLTNSDKRNDHNEMFVDGKVGDVDTNRLKSGWKNAVKFTNSLDQDGLNKINDLYGQKSKKRSK